ncbi:hypothetical protein BGX26_006180 [Mortierella sp. AD094]|nr:hypothetical protein BGX26_006180 [Mortierella sp. AD094]
MKANIPYEIFEEASALKPLPEGPPLPLALQWFERPKYTVSLPNLQNVLLSLNHPERIHLNKRVLYHVENGDYIVIKTSDNMTHEGNILVGADGTYSVVRQSLYEHLDKRGLLPASDKDEISNCLSCEADAFLGAKMNSSAGLGALTAVGDAVVLANYINTLTSVESEEVEDALKAYTIERYPIDRTAVETSAAVFKGIKQVLDF